MMDDHEQPVVIGNPNSYQRVGQRLTDDPAIMAMVERVHLEAQMTVESSFDPGPSPLQQLSKSQDRLLNRWSEQFGQIPVDELQAILRDQLGCNTEEVRREVAERAMMLWTNANELRMKRDLKNPPVLKT